MIELWQFEVCDPRTGRWQKTRYRMTEQEARERFGPDARKCRVVAPSFGTATPRRRIQRAAFSAAAAYVATLADKKSPLRGRISAGELDYPGEPR